MVKNKVVKETYFFMCIFKEHDDTIVAMTEIKLQLAVTEKENKVIVHVSCISNHYPIQKGISINQQTHVAVKKTFFNRFCFHKLTSHYIQGN